MAQDAWAKEDFAECFADFRVELCLCRLLRPSTFSVVVVVVEELPAQAAAHCSRRITTRQPVEGPTFQKPTDPGRSNHAFSVVQAAHGTVLAASVRQPPVKLSS